jgi:hypothetical protein
MIRFSEPDPAGLRFSEPDPAGLTDYHSAAMIMLCFIAMDVFVSICK